MDFCYVCLAFVGYTVLYVHLVQTKCKLMVKLFYIVGPRARKRMRGSDTVTIDIENRLESLITRVGEKVCLETTTSVHILTWVDS